MRSMNDSPNNNGSTTTTTNNNISTPNWLGFSLSPHMKMEEPQNQLNHQIQASTAAAHNVPRSFYISSSYGENGGFHSPLSIMPLKSDGSLCLMEALSRSQHSQGNNNCSYFFFIKHLIKS